MTTHKRSYQINGTTTLKEHQPTSHQKIAEVSADEWIDWGLTVGPATAECMLNICTDQHPKRAHRICTGIQSLLKSYGAERLEQACGKSLLLGHVSYSSLKLMLANHLEAVSAGPSQSSDSGTHQNIRGADYYQPQQGAMNDAGNS